MDGLTLMQNSVQVTLAKAVTHYRIIYTDMSAFSINFALYIILLARQLSVFIIVGI
jgi:hypothetical protein